MTTPLRMADSNIPSIHASLQASTSTTTATKRRPVLSSTPFTAPLRTTTDIDADLSSFSLEVTLAHLIDFLVHKLEAIYPPHLVQTLRRSIVSHLTPKLAPTWDPLNPSSGSGVRSLIALPGKFPTPLVKAAIEVGIDPVKWTRAISETGEWEIWVDPGSVCFREGGWAFGDEAFENKTYKQTLHTVWHAPLPIETSDDFYPDNLQGSSALVPPSSSSNTSMKRSNVPIRAPAVFRIPSSPMPLVQGMRSLSLRQPDHNGHATTTTTTAATTSTTAGATTTTNPFDVGSSSPHRYGHNPSSSSSSHLGGGIAMMAGSAPLIKRSLPNHQQTRDSTGTGSGSFALGSASGTASASPGPGWNTGPASSTRSMPLKGKRIAPQVVAMPIGDAAVGAGRRSASPVLPSSLARSGHLSLMTQTPRSISLGTPANASDLLALLNRKPEPLKDEQISFASSSSASPALSHVAQPRTPPKASGPAIIPDTPGSVVTVRPRSPSSVVATAGTATSIASSSPRTDTTNSPGTAARVQGYDGGNVGVLGGGVKLGGQGVPKTPNVGGNRSRSASGTSVLSGMSGKRTVSGSSSVISEEGSPEYNAGMTSPSPVDASPVGGIVHPHQPKRRRGRPQNRPYFGAASPKGGLPIQPGAGIAGQPGSGGSPMGAPFGYHQTMTYGHGQVPIGRSSFGSPQSGPAHPIPPTPLSPGSPGNVPPPPAWNNVGLVNGMPAMTPNPGGWGVNPAVLNAVAPPIGGGVPGQPGTGHPGMPPHHHHLHHQQQHQHQQQQQLHHHHHQQQQQQHHQQQQQNHHHPHSPNQNHGGHQMNTHVANAAGINVAAWNLGVASGMITQPQGQAGPRRS